MSDLYFAYGSNLKLARMRARVASARALATARLDGFRLALDKRGSDGSGKANLARQPGTSVWGVVYRLDPEHWPVLDAHEPGYRRVPVGVWTEGGELEAETYLARIHTDDPVAWDWYKRLIVEGAREHGLPADWLATLETLPERPPPER